MHMHTSVRRFRKSAFLAQDELAELLGVAQSSVSRIEAGEIPDGTTILGLQILFDQSPQSLFPDLYDVAAEEIVRCAAELDLRLAAKLTRRVRHQREWLRAMMARVTPQPA